MSQDGEGSGSAAPKRKISTYVYPGGLQDQVWKEIEDIISDCEAVDGDQYDPMLLNPMIKTITKEKKLVIETRCKERNIKVKPGRKMIDSKVFIKRSKQKIAQGKGQLNKLESSDEKDAKSIMVKQKLRN